MLSSIIWLKKVFRKNTILLLFISLIAIHTQASADSKEQTAEQYRAQGYAEQQKGNLNEALAFYTKATSLGIENAVLFNDMGVLYEEIDLNGRAEKYYLMAIQKDANYLPAYINVAYLYKRLGEKDKAARYFKKRYELGNPDESWAQKALEELLEIKPEYAEWVQRLEADALSRQLVQKSHDEFYRRVEQSQTHFKTGNVLHEEKKYKEAIREYDLALQLSPDDPKIKNARKQIELDIAKENIREQSEQAIKSLETGDTVSARNEIQKILTTIPNKPVSISQ